MTARSLAPTLIGQEFKSDKYFHGRPSATTAPDPNDATKTVPAPYNAANSGGSNLGPSNKALIDRVQADIDALKKENPSEPVPIDLVTTSAQRARSRTSRPRPRSFRCRALPRRATYPKNASASSSSDTFEERFLGILGEPRVNVLLLNIALEADPPDRSRPSTRHAQRWRNNDTTYEYRPSPEALLEAARREEGRVGKLRIFVGAAPGVGKTYEMLQQAHARKKDGYDVVVGVVETHGRKDTDALLDGLEIVPRRRIDYKGSGSRRWTSMPSSRADHRSCWLTSSRTRMSEGSRHPKRYLDVEELMSHGIDVYTTVNIQHIESLNDVVAQITHVRVRETVPDAVFDRADAVELVDLTPDDLIQRLKEGKVYVPKQAERALEHFFSPANLTALRELALRRTAERVDEQLLTEMQAHAIQGPWAAGERILVCISEDPRCAGLVRYSKRLADRLHGSWMALYVEGRRALQLSEEERDRIADTLRLAETLGGEALTLPASDRRIADDVIRYAQANNVTQIVIGKSSRTRWFELLHGSVVHDLVRRSGNISVHVIAGDYHCRRTHSQKIRAPRRAGRCVQSTALCSRAGSGSVRTRL